MRSASVLILVVSTLALGQSGSTSPANSVASPQSAAARQLIERAIQNLQVSPEGATFNSFALTGVLHPAGSTEIQPVRVLSRGTRELRLEITHQDGTIHLVVKRKNSGCALRDRTGKIMPIVRNARVGTEIPFLPLPNLLTQLLASDAVIQDLGTDSVGGRPVYHVAVSHQFPAIVDPDGLMTAHSKIDFFIDGTTLLILKLAHTAADVKGKMSLAREVTFDDYRAVGGVMVPFAMTETVDGQLNWSLSVSSIDFSHAFQGSDFQM